MSDQRALNLNMLQSAKARDNKNFNLNRSMNMRTQGLILSKYNSVPVSNTKKAGASGVESMNSSFSGIIRLGNDPSEQGGDEDVFINRLGRAPEKDDDDNSILHKFDQMDMDVQQVDDGLHSPDFRSEMSGAPNMGFQGMSKLQ